MLASPPAVLLTLVLQAGPALAQSDAAACMADVRHIDVSAESSGEARPVCISPGQTTVFSFDAQLAPGSVSVEEAARFAKVEPGPSTLKLVPSEKVPLGKPLRVTVRFADGAAPSSAAFVLVAHAAHSASLVEVHREERSPESYQQEVRAKEEEVRRCREENARLRAERATPGGLVGPLVSGVIGVQGVAAANLLFTVQGPLVNSLEVGALRGYRSANRVVLALTLSNRVGAPTWTAEDATLTLASKRGEGLKVLSVWQASPILPGEYQRVMVEAEVPTDGTRGPFTLTLWAAGGQHAVTLEDVTFP